ncbi:MAG TPA: alpha/beta hydrolase [Acidimicrobiaceae bacterium]|nr:alpha/beta hydrolase [Acidimicrobiaceae bacterium]
MSVDGATVGFTTGGVDVGSAGVGPERPAALLVHGAGMNRTVWQQQTRYLNHHGATALAVDLPGHGNSAGAPLATVAEMAAWLVRLADEVVVRLGGAPAGRRVALVGHSMGSLVCLEAAATAPDRFSRLVLAGTAMSMPVHPDLLDAAERNEPLAAELMTAWGHGPAAHVAASPTPGMWMLGGGLALLAAAADGVIFADLSACDAYEVGDAAGRVECPVTVVVGGADKMTPPRAAAPLIAGFDSADVVHLADVGHMMMSEDPAAVRRALRAALCG